METPGGTKANHFPTRPAVMSANAHVRQAQGRPHQTERHTASSHALVIFLFLLFLLFLCPLFPRWAAEEVLEEEWTW